MEELYDLGISINTIYGMLEICPNLKDITNDEVRKKVELLEQINCNENQIQNIISSNPMYLDRINEDVIKIINKLYNLKFNNLNILFEANPYILNLDPYEIDNYIKERLINGEKLIDIIDDLDTNPYLFNEM